MTLKEKERNKQIKIIENAKKNDLYKDMLNYFSDAELVDVKPIKKNDE
jgi:hypothetical protein